MEIIEELNKIIKDPPVLVQISINAIWEDCWTIPFKDGNPSVKKIDKYLSKGTQRIAFEIFFRTNDGYDIFFGVRFKKGLKTITPRDFLLTSFESIWSIEPPTFSEIVSDLSKQLTGHPESLFSSYPTGIELGVSNWWKSMGSIEIWNDTQNKIIDRKTLKEQLDKATHLLQNEKNYAAMEFNYAVVPHYWIGIQVSDKKEEIWVLNEKRLENLLQKFLDIGVL